MSSANQPPQKKRGLLIALVAGAFAHGASELVIRATCLDVYERDRHLPHPGGRAAPAAASPSGRSSLQLQHAARVRDLPHPDLGGARRDEGDKRGEHVVR